MLTYFYRRGTNEVIKNSSAHLQNKASHLGTLNSNSETKKSHIEKYINEKRKLNIKNLKANNSFISKAKKTGFKMSDAKFKISTRLDNRLKLGFDEGLGNEIHVYPAQDQIDKIRIGFRSPKTRINNDSILEPNLIPPDYKSRQALHQKIRSLERDVNLPDI